MTERRKPTNGVGGLKWTTIVRLLPIPAMIIGFGITHILQFDRLSSTIENHCEVDSARDAALLRHAETNEARLHAAELSIAAMQGGE